MKKLLSILLALTLALSLGATAFAADPVVDIVHNETVLEAIKAILDEIDPSAYDELVAFIDTDEFQAEYAALMDKISAVIEDPTEVAGMVDDYIEELAELLGLDIEEVKEMLAESGLFDWIAKLYMPGVPETTTVEATTAVEDTVPPTGSAAGSLAIFATLSIAAAAAFVCTKKN
ncbi:MAG TPA: hypothetical protein VFD23_06140 [Clostridia bacterium]|nr:hypothetical protein [Clostridia bacterium]